MSWRSSAPSEPQTGHMMISGPEPVCATATSVPPSRLPHLLINCRLSDDNQRHPPEWAEICAATMMVRALQRRHSGVGC